MRNKGTIRKICAAAAATFPLLLATPAFPALPEDAPAVPGYLALQPTEAAPLLSPPAASAHLFLPATEAPPSGWKSDFSARLQDPVGERPPGFFLQRGEYSRNGVSLLAEMGDIRIGETPNTSMANSRRGGRLAISAGSSGNALRFQSFALPGAGESGSRGMLLGAAGELSLLEESARFKTVYLSGRERSPSGMLQSGGERRGDVLGMVAALEPIKERLAAEAEVDFSLFDQDTGDDAEPVRDSAYRVKMGGKWGRYRYSALYERTGPEYRLLGGEGPTRDSEGISLGLESSFRRHGIDLKLSRYNDNTAKNPLYPRLYRTEGVVDYTLKAFQSLPLGLRYRKSFVESDREPSGYSARDSEEDALSGRVNYLAGRWDLGLLASYWQRSDRLRQDLEAKATTISFLPKFAAGTFSIVPNLSLKRSRDAATLRSDLCAVTLGINGSALGSRLDYELKGAFRKEWSPLSSGRESFGAKVKAVYPLANLFKGTVPPSIGIRGEYNPISDPLTDGGSRTFSLLLSFEAASFL